LRLPSQYIESGTISTSGTRDLLRFAPPAQTVNWQPNGVLLKELDPTFTVTQGAGASGRPAAGSGPHAFTTGEILAGRYRIVGLLGRGGMGEVYRAEDLTLGQHVALKFLPSDVARDPERLERLLAEVRITRQVSHPNVCRVYDIGSAGGRHFLTMEFVDGEDLASLLRRIGRLSPDKALDIARQLCAGLAAAHDRGVIHRDLKPANIMLATYPQAASATAVPRRITSFMDSSAATSQPTSTACAGAPTRRVQSTTLDGNG